MAAWFEIVRQNLSRPGLWPELLRKLCNRFSHNRSSPDYLAELAAMSRPWRDILAELHGEELQGTGQQDDEYQSLIRELEEKERDCPVRLGGGAHIQLLYDLVRRARPKVVLETGVAYGWSSAVILLGLAQNGAGHLYSSDLPYPRIPRAADYVGWVVPDKLRQRWTLRLGSDRQNLPGFLDDLDRIDLFHYDSDKSYRGRIWASRQVWPRLPEGGLFLADDIQNNRAFLDFCRLEGQTAYVTHFHGKYIGLCRKRRVDLP